MPEADFKQFVTTWLPPLAGVGLIAMFISLASWQLDRAAQKEALVALFSDSAAPQRLSEIAIPQLFQPVLVSGEYLPERQVLIDNIINNGRVGYNVITPFKSEPAGEVLLVNRGWLAKETAGDSLPPIAVDTGRRTIAARVGRLPRVAVRPGAAFAETEGWPRVAVYPRLEDVASVTGFAIQPPVLLLSAAADDGFVRDWQPAQQGPMKHYGYAFQWSALALTVLVVLLWQLGKRVRNEHR
ncbi:MAG: SURF1 family protein [Woeseia sp.]|nr:SURF1 family protein [Woeseia sp.]MBT8097512.1 SURF1 family protein [Woeseia sp.]